MHILAANAQADSPELDFSQCLATIAQESVASGVPEQQVETIISRITRLDRVIELDQSQPEFTQTFAGYLNTRVTQQRISQGRIQYQNLAPLMQNITDTYGVPGRYLIAFWGLETNFGGYLGNVSTLDSLATLACDSRRSEFFTNELITAIKLVDRYELDPNAMHGSWAGAMGHTQFMPSTWDAYAVDGDGDGEINLWTSIEDALASGANYLQNVGWSEGERWGREVRLPPNFPYELSGSDVTQTLSEWNALGVTRTDGTPIPPLAMEARLLLPSGHRGPAFLVYPNFRVIMNWNRSESYALSVGILADRIAGAGELFNPPDVNEPALSREMVFALQTNLNQLGFDAGEPDGVIGPATRSGLRAFQSSVNLIADGYPSPETLQKLGL